MAVAGDKQVLLDLAHVGFVRRAALQSWHSVGGALSMVTMERDLHSPRLLCLSDTQKEQSCSSREDHSRKRTHHCRRPKGLVWWHALLGHQGLGGGRYR